MQDEDSRRVEPSTVSLRQVATHEAGHAVACFALARGMRHITIVPTDEASSRVAEQSMDLLLHLDSQSPQTPRERERLCNSIVICLAGVEAEAHLLGHSPEDLYEHAYHDLQKADRFVEQLEPPSVAPALFQYLQARTTDLIAVHWYLVECLAEELLVRKTLSAPAVHRTLRKAITRAASQSEFHKQTRFESLSPNGWRGLADDLGREITRISDEMLAGDPDT
jgi:hypothetical protein